MVISEFLIKILILFFPGVIAKLLVDQLITVEKRTPFYFTVYSFVLGVLSYVGYSLILGIIWCGAELLSLTDAMDITFRYKVNFLQSLIDKTIHPSYLEVLMVSFIALGLGMFWGKANRDKWFHRILKDYWKITDKFSDIGVWEFVHNSEDVENWAFVRDLKEGLIYYGWIEAYSDTVEASELYLKKVKVYNLKTGKPVSESEVDIAAIYIARDKNLISLAFPNAK